ncbi:MAG: IPT/TIG domain-containing protein, partial [Terriglobales bacterium]
ATPDGKYLVIARQDGTVIYDLVAQAVAARETTTTGNRLVAAYRDLGNPNAFAYQVTAAGVLSAIDLRTGSPTFGSIVASANAATADPYYNSTAIQPDGILVSADGTKVFTTDFGGLITTVNVASLLANAGGAAFNTTTYPNQFDFNSMFGGPVDVTAVVGAPTVTGVTLNPPAPTPGTAVTLTINGTNFAPDAIVFGGGDRFNPTEIASVTPTQITVQTTISASDTSGTFDIGVTNPNLTTANQENVSGILRNAVTIASAGVTDTIGVIAGSNAVVRVSPSFSSSAPPSPPFLTLATSIALTTDGAYAFSPIGATGVDVVNFATGVHTIHSVPNNGVILPKVLRSVDPNTAASIVYFTDGSTLFELDANPASGSFGNSLGSIGAGIPSAALTSSIAASPNGRYVYAAETNTGLTPGQQVLIYDFLSGTRPASLALSNVGASTSQPSTIVTPDGKYLVLRLSNTSQLGLFNLANPLAPVLTNTLTANLPAGYTGANFSNYLVAKDRLYALGTAADSANFGHTFLEIFRYDPSGANFSSVQTLINDRLYPGPMQISSDGSKLYIADSSGDDVTVVDIIKASYGDPNAVVASLNAPYGPSAIDVPYSAASPTYGLTLAMTHTPEPAARTGLVTFVLTATNTGNADLTNTTITNPLPSGTSFISTNSTCGLVSTTITCTIGVLPAGASIKTSFTLLMPSVISGVTDTATILATEYPTGTIATNTVNIGNGADISVTASASPGTTTPGGSVTFNTTVTNNGPDNSGATVTETLPAGFAFVSASYNNPSSGSGPCTVSGQVVTCNAGSLPYSGTPTSATITLTATAGSQLGLFSLGVQAAPQNNEVNALNNSTTAPVIVSGSANAQEALIIDENAQSSLRFLQPSTLTEFNSIPQLMGVPRIPAVVSPNGRLLFTGYNYIGAIDLSLKAEIRRIPVAATGAYQLTPDGKTLVVPVNDSVVLVDTATFQTTIINLNGLVGDDASKTSDIRLNAAAIANNKAYFNPNGTFAGATLGLPVIVVDLSSHAVSTISVPGTGTGANVSFELSGLAATPDGHYLVVQRTDGLAVIDLTNNSVVSWNPFIAGANNINVATVRTATDPNQFAYVLTVQPRRLYQIDLRAGSPTFGQSIGRVSNSSTQDEYGYGGIAWGHLAVAADDRTVFSDDFFKAITKTDTTRIQTSQATAATTTVLQGIDLNSSSLALVDFSPVAGAPTISSISPSVITTDGATVTVNGANFATDSVVRFGQGAPIAATYISATQLQVTIPPGVPAQSAMDVIVTNPNTAAPVSQQSLSGILRAVFSVQLPASVRLASPLVSPMLSNGVTFIDRYSQFNAIAQNPLHEVQGAGAITSDGGYLITPVSGDQINSTTPVDAGIAITNLATGATTIQTSPIQATAAGAVSIIRSVNPAGGAPVMYLLATNDSYTDVVVEMIDANPASGTFGTVLASVNAGVPSGQYPGPIGLAATPDGRYVFAGSEDLNTGSSTYRVYVFDMLNHTLLWSFNPANFGAAQNQRLMTFAGGDLLMVMSNSANIGAFDVTTTPGTAVLDGTLTGILPEGATSLSVRGFDFAGNLVYVSGMATFSSGATAPTLEAFHFDKPNNNYSALGQYTASPVTDSGPLAVSSDGTQIYLTATGNDQVQIFDTAKLTSNTAGALVASFGTPFGPAKFVANGAASVPSTDLQLTMTASPEPVAIGGVLTFHYTISNNGPLEATNVVLTDTLPAGTSIVGSPSISCGAATCSCNNASPLVCSVSTIGVSSSVTGTFSITAPASAGSYTNNASVVADQAATTTSNSISVSGTAVVGADVSVTISQPTNPALTNTAVTYTVVVNNAGQNDATGVSLQLDGGNNFSVPSSITTTQGTCTNNPPNCSLGTIVAGSSATVTVTTTSKYPGSFTVLAASTANEADPNPANNTAYQTTMFLPSLNAASRFIVPDWSSGRLRQYAVSTNTEVAIGNEPTAGYAVGAVAVMPNGRIGFTSQFSNYVSVVDFSIGKEIARIPIRARTLALTPDGTKLLLVNGLADELDVVDTSTLNVVNQISYNGLSGLGDDPNSADVNAGGIVLVGSKVYLNAQGTQFNLTTGFPIIVIDLNSNSAAVVPGSDVGRGYGLPNAIGATPDGKYVVALRTAGTQSLVIDPATDAVLFTFTNFAPGSGAMAITADANDPHGYLAYISTGLKTNVLDLRQGSPTFGQFLIGGGGVSVATGNAGITTVLSSDGSRLYVAAGAPSTTAPQVDVYDTAALLTSPATAYLGGLHISDYVTRAFTAITDTTVPSGAPTISSVTPAAVVYEQPTQVAINGSNFSSDARVRIGKGDLIVPDSISPTQLLVTVPAQTPAGTLDVTVVDLNSAAPQSQQLTAAVATATLTVAPPVSFAPKYQVVGHDSGDGSVFQMVRSSTPAFVNQIALVPGAVSPDGSTLWVPITAGLLPYNFDTHTGTVVTGIPNAQNVGGIATGIDPVTSHAVVYLATHGTGTTFDTMLEIVDAASSSPTFGQVLRTINANLNDRSVAYSAAATPDGRYVYTATYSTTGRLVIYDTLTNTST